MSRALFCASLRDIASFILQLPATFWRNSVVQTDFFAVMRKTYIQQSGEILDSINLLA